MKTTLSRRKALAGMGLFAGVTALSGCSVNPVTGKPELMLMTENQEISMGTEAHDQIVAEYGAYQDNSLQEWFGEKGDKMALHTQRRNLPWKFTVLDSPVINAFAVPGGFIYVTRGILAYFNNEAQFAGVLGHELGHVNARHTASTYSKAKLANLGIAVGSIVSQEFAQFADIASMGTQLLFLKFSRDDEREADRLGVQYSSATGYDAREVSSFFTTLERLHPSSGRLPEWQSTHPDPGDRVNSTRKQAISIQDKNPGEYILNRNEYMERIDGLVFGEDPRQGYVKDGIFYHPEMKFQFPVPRDWTVTNQPKQVAMTPEKNNAMLMFTIADGYNPKDAAKAFAQQNSVKVESSGEFKTVSEKGYRQAGTMEGQQQQLGIQSYFIPMHERVYVFHGLSAMADMAGFESQFSSTAKGFDMLKDEKLIDVTPEKIEIRTIAANMPLRDAFNLMGVPEDQTEKLAIVNGFTLGDPIKAGTRIKILS